MNLPHKINNNVFRYDFEKPGSCPPPLPVRICSQSCFSDAQCSDIGKCCPTNCGGFICTRPVTKVEAVSRGKVTRLIISKNDARLF